MNNQKIRGSVYGPGVFSKASWPFGSIEISNDQIKFVSFPKGCVIKKEAIKTIKRSALFGGFKFFYSENGTDRNVSFSPLTKSATQSLLISSGYKIE